MTRFVVLVCAISIAVASAHPLLERLLIGFGREEIVFVVLPLSCLCSYLIGRFFQSNEDNLLEIVKGGNRLAAIKRAVFGRSRSRR